MGNPNTARQLMENGEAKRTIADESYVRMLSKKWGPMLEGIDTKTQAGRHRAAVTAILLENEMEHLRSLTEDTRAANVGPFTKFIFPILRRVFPNLIANDIVSVQPMTAPVGAVFFFEYKYGSTKGRITAGDNLVQKFDLDYSSENVTAEAIGAAGDGASLGPFTGTASWLPIKSGTLVVNWTTGSVAKSVNPDVDGDGTFAAGGGIAAGSINFTSGAFSVTFQAANAPDLGTRVTIDYTYNTENNSSVPQINLDIQLQEIRATTRKLKALWSSEAADDLRAFHGLDAETELVGGIAQEIALELDREIINDLVSVSTGSVASFDRNVPAGISEQDHLRDIVTPLATVSNLIHKKTLRAPGNFLITSPEVVALLETLPTFVSEDPKEYAFNYGIVKAGVLQKKWMVYKDPFFDTRYPTYKGKILVGLKMPSFLDAGYAWAPFVPLQVTPTFLDPGDFSFRKGMRTRYAKKVLRSEFYGQVNVVNL
jgi:hypothetical protein